MADVITLGDLAAYLDPAAVSGARAELIVDLTNGLIAERWTTPSDPAPTSVRVLALNVAARAWRNKPGHGPLESITRSIDDASRTERYAIPVGDGSGADVFLTDAELATLNGLPAKARVGSIRLGVPGFARSRDW